MHSVLSYIAHAAYPRLHILCAQTLIDDVPLRGAGAAAHKLLCRDLRGGDNAQVEVAAEARTGDDAYMEVDADIQQEDRASHPRSAAS